MKSSKRRRSLAIKIFCCLIVILAVGFLLPQDIAMPVEGATRNSYAQNSFWAYPWGESVTHKGVDIFAPEATPVHSATKGMVVWTGQNRLGGNFVLVLGPKWRLHYYAHLHEIKAHKFALVSHQSILGTVGNTGDARGKPYHLHYTIKDVIPHFWRADHGVQGWLKAYFVNPIPYLNESFGAA